NTPLTGFRESDDDNVRLVQVYRECWECLKSVLIPITPALHDRPRLKEQNDTLFEHSGFIVHRSSLTVHPNATSSTIITLKPSRVAGVARSVLPARCDSGMSSSPTRKSMAPAAKESA